MALRLPILTLLLASASPVAAAQSYDCTGEASPVLKVAEPHSSVDTIKVTAGIATLALPLTVLDSKSNGAEIEITLGSAQQQAPTARFHCPEFYFGARAPGTYNIKLWQVLDGKKTLVATREFEVSDTGTPTYTNVVPTRPVAGEPFSVRIRGSTPHYPAVVQPHHATVQGNVIRVEGCVSGGGFAVPDYYVATAGVPAISAGRYRVEYHRCFFDYPPPLRTYTFLGSFDVEVKARSATWPGPPDAVMPVSEYFHAGFQHAFITGDEREQVALDSHSFEGWELARTTGGDSNKYGIWSTGEGRNAVCRFFSTAFAPKSSHFYTASAVECEKVKANPDWMFEGVVGYVGPTSAPSGCDAGVPLLRLYNNGAGGAPSHRYTLSAAEADSLVQQGWIAEGVMGCVPQIPRPYRP